MTQRASSRAANTPPSGTVTFLFTDIEGSTAMYENYPAQMQGALKRHDDILRSTIEAHGGYVFKTVGDAFCAAFATARDAINATLVAQRALFAEEWPENAEVRVRMGLHTGVADEHDGDYFGPPVNRVARLMSTGHGGQVLLSDATYNLARDHLVHQEPKAKLRDLGEHRLKDLRFTEHIFQLSVPDLPKNFPPVKTRGLVTPSDISNLDRRYVRARHVGGGAFGEVYLVHDETLYRDVALKVLKNQHADDEQFAERFKREARNSASLSHPNIVQVYDAGEGFFEGNRVSYIAMEYVSGGTLKDLVRYQKGPLSARTALELTRQVARALEVAHRRGVIHRDIKPQNILLTESGEAKVADFGIARAAASSTTLTRTGVMIGTLHYVAPEQVQGQPASPRSDLYALGVVFYEMLTGELPFDAETPAAIMMKHITGQPRPLKEANPGVPERVEAVAVRLLAKNPEERYPNAAALMQDLERVLRSLEEKDQGRTMAQLAPTEEQPTHLDEEEERPTYVDEEAESATHSDDMAPDSQTVSDETEASPSPVVEVPDLSDQNVSLVSDTLANSGLTLGAQEDASSETIPEGDIIGQTPRAGAEVEPDSPVSVTVSSGPSTVEVPDLAGLTRSRASNTLTAVGLKLGGQDKAPNDVPEGDIVGQEPATGTKAKRDSSVSITVSSGPEEKVVTIVPDVSSRSTEETEHASSNAGPVTTGSRTEEQRVGSEDSSRQTAQGATVRSEKRAKLWIWMGLLCAVVVVGLITALAYSLSGGETANFTLASTLTGHSDSVFSVAFSPDGSLLASGSADETVKLWDPQTGEEFQTLTGHSDYVNSVAFSPDGSLLASGSKFDEPAKLWDPQSGELLQTLTGRSDFVAFSPDGSLLTTDEADDTVKLWDPQSGELLQTLTGYEGRANSVAFSPDGGILLASITNDDTVKLWDSQSGELLQTLTGHSLLVTAAAFSPDRDILASGSFDDTVKLWDPQSGEELRTLTGHSGTVKSVAFSPDGSLLASSSADHTVKLWDPQTGEELQTLTGHEGSVSVGPVTFSPDGRLLASGPSGGTIDIWQKAGDE